MSLFLKAIRKEKGMTQKQIARLASITQPTYSNIENQRRMPSVETAKKIAEALEIDWVLLFSD